MELLQYWRVVQKNLWLIVLLAIVGTGSAAFYTLQQSIIYQSTATLLLNPSVPSSLVPYVQKEVSTSLANSYAEAMRSQSFAASVVKALPLPLSSKQVTNSITT